MTWKWFGLAALLTVLPAWGGDVAAGLSGESIQSVVRVDRRTGRLVRRVVVPPHVIQSKVVPSRNLASETRNGFERAGLQSGNEKLDSIVDEVSAGEGVDPLLVHAIIHVESRYNRFAISPKGAEGLMQLIPTTARQHGVANSFDTRQNIAGGVKHLRGLQGRFDDLRLVLAAYNAGEGAVDRWRGIPPYPETQEYVYKVGKRYGELRRSQTSGLATTARSKDSAQPQPPQHRALESFLDTEGRLHLRTR